MFSVVYPVNDRRRRTPLLQTMRLAVCLRQTTNDQFTQAMHRRLCNLQLLEPLACTADPRRTQLLRLAPRIHLVQCWAM